MPALDHVEKGGDTARISGLSDGLFAIVLTLLVLELGLPEASLANPAAFMQALVELWPKLFGYGLNLAKAEILAK